MVRAYAINLTPGSDEPTSTPPAHGSATRTAEMDQMTAWKRRTSPPPPPTPPPPPLAPPPMCVAAFSVHAIAALQRMDAKEKNCDVFFFGAIVFGGWTGRERGE